jgi:hypothetical protein
MPGTKPKVHLVYWQLDASGHLIGFTADGHVVRLELSMPVPPALLQADTSSSEGISFTSCEMTEFRQDWANLLTSGEGADVQLRCAEGAVVRAHSAVLLARWEYYRVLQRNLQAGMTGGGAAGEVDVSEHSAATMQLVLQHLYTGKVQLEAPPPGDRSNSIAGGPNREGQEQEGAAAGGSKASRKRDAQGELKAPAPGEPTPGTTDSLSQGATSSSSAAAAPAGAAAGAAPEPLDSAPFVLVPLMRAADALLLPDLHDACLEVAQQQLAPDNALPLLLAAHQAQLELLEKEVMAYVVKNIRGEGLGVSRCVFLLPIAGQKAPELLFLSLQHRAYLIMPMVTREEQTHVADTMSCIQMYPPNAGPFDVPDTLCIVC